MERPTAEQVRAALLEQKSKAENFGKKGGDNASYPFWNIPDNSTATVRFLPDADSENMFFWRQRLVIKMPFAGVVGGENPTDREVIITVPCVEMFGMACPVMAATRPMWKDGREDIARRYWKKKSYLMSGFVVNSPITEETVPENPIRRFVVNPSIYEIIEKSLISPDMEDMPTDYIGGRDFKIAKTKKGEWSNYSTSSWAFKTRSLTETERAAIDQYGLNDLKQGLGRIPDKAELEAIKEMFDASLAGEPFDVESFGQYYRPYTSNNENNNTVSKVKEVLATEKTETPSSGRINPQDVIQRIRDRANR